MAISQHTRFENHMDIASPETMGDAQKKSDFFDESPYDDDFEAKLSQVDKNMFPNENSTSYINESADRTAASSHIKKENERKGEKGESLALNPTMPPLPKVAEGGDGSKQEELDLSNNRFGSYSQESSRNISSFQQTAEKVIALASALDVVGDMLSGGATAVEKPNKIDIGEIPVQSSIVSTEGHHDTRSLNDVVGDLGFEIDHHERSVDDALIDVGQAIESMGSDTDNQAEFIDESSRNNMEDDVERSNSDLIVENGNVPMPPDSNIEFKTDMVYRSVVDANPEFGDGGGIQYFIPHASEIKEAGRLDRIVSSEIFGFDSKDIVKADIRASVNSEYKMHLDKRKISGEDATEILSSSSDITSGKLSESISAEDLQYFDENTIASEGLTDNSDRFFINEKGVLDSHEDYYRPHGNQEDTYKKENPENWIMPDSWANPVELKDGEVFYQLAPVFRDGKSDTFSSYFTDKDTVDLCRDENGIISISALMQKLQMPPKTEILEDSGERKEVYVGRYELTAYIYKKEPNN